VISINVQVIGENIKVMETPTLATDTLDTVEVVFSFDEEWEGFTKTAMFWGDDDEEYSAQVIEDKAIIPHEALLEAGVMKFGVYGINGNKRLVSMKTPYKIAKGIYVEHDT